MVSQSLLNRVEALEASQAKDPELLAEKTNLAIDEMIRSMPVEYDNPEDFEKAKLNLMYGHHLRYMDKDEDEN